MRRNAGYENKLVWIIITVVIMAVAATAVWLYQANLVTFGLKQLNVAGCPGNKASVSPYNGNKWDKKCVRYNSKDGVDCSGIQRNSSYKTPDGHTGGCYKGHSFPTFN